MSEGRRTKDKQMASNLKKAGTERTQGRCCVCGKIITIDRPELPYQKLVFNHMAAHARGAA